jgi:hypothetical protein
MSDDTNVLEAPESNPGRETGDTQPAQTSDRDVQPETGQAEVQGVDRNTNPELPNETGNACNATNEITTKPSVSARKLEANRQNAQHSSGPKTEQGKAKSSKNAIKHGFFAGKLFGQTEQGSIEHQEYEELGFQLFCTYQPVGFKEELLVEQIFIELVRSGRILKYEQRVLSNTDWFLDGSLLEKVLRYSACHSRQLTFLMAAIETEQSKRKGHNQTSGEPAAE